MPKAGGHHLEQAQEAMVAKAEAAVPYRALLPSRMALLAAHGSQSSSEAAAG